MNYLHQIDKWSINHHPSWFVVLRALLGLSLIIKGIQFIKNTSVLEQMINQTVISQNFSWLNTFIPFLHLFGGSMIMAGLFTRLSVLVQLPVLLGAVFFVNSRHNIFAGESDLFFSVVVLLLLVFFLVEGGGSFSLDNALRNQKR
jgi:putative oxidoreductase